MTNDNILYLKRLKSFSSSTKYQIELTFLFSLMSPIKRHERILDYGCGTGTTIRFLQKSTNAKIFGYDIEKYIEDDLKPAFLYKVEGKFNKVIFQHSIAHIANIKEILINLRDNFIEQGEIFVITPNKEFDEYFKKIKDKNYTPDLTVYKHYTSCELIDLFHSCGYKIKISGTFGNVENNIHERCFLIAYKY